MVGRSEFFNVYFITFWIFFLLFIRLVNGLLHTQCVSVMVNGSLKGYFPSSRGIRQGDQAFSLLLENIE